MKTSPAGIALIKHFEGLRLTAYRCSAGVLTIGWGHTAGVQEGGRITQLQAEALFAADLQAAEADLAQLTAGVPLTQGQFDALISFDFNFGRKKLAGSTLHAKLLAHDFAGAAAEFPKWIHSAGKEDAGLVKRRAAEKALFEGRA